MLRAVLFDLDNTLLLEDEATDRALRTAAQLAEVRLGAPADRLAMAAARAARELFRAAPVFAYADAIGVSSGEVLWGEFAGATPGLRALHAFAPGFRVQVWTAALDGLGIGRDAAGSLPRELAHAFVRARTAGQLVDPAGAEVLELLGARYRLALVTNGAPQVQRAKLAGTALASRFAAIVVSGDLGVGKPDPAPVRAALQALGVAPEEAAMVGDSRARDVAAARAAGAYAIWLDRGTKEGAARSRERQPRPDARISDLRELPALLGGLHERLASPRGSRAPRPT